MTSGTTGSSRSTSAARAATKAALAAGSGTRTRPERLPAPAPEAAFCFAALGGVPGAGLGGVGLLAGAAGPRCGEGGRCSPSRCRRRPGGAWTAAERRWQTGMARWPWRCSWHGGRRPCPAGRSREDLASQEKRQAPTSPGRVGEGWGCRVAARPGRGRGWEQGWGWERGPDPHREWGRPRPRGQRRAGGCAAAGGTACAQVTRPSPRPARPG